MKAFYFVAVVLTVAVAVDAKAANLLEEHPIDWYDCSAKPDGNYVHPTDCTRFISCSGGIASQRDCANCNVDPVRCPEGRTVYNATVDECLWADETECGTGENTDLPTDATTPDSGSTPVVDPTTADPNACDPELCKNEGYCQSYRRCNNGTLVQEECGEGLVWNPLNPDGSEHIHGGNCDVWENLRPETEEQYRKDPDCLACFWQEKGECEQDYLYQAPALRHRAVHTLRCADGLVFSQAKETCQRCQDVLRGNGQPCCGNATAPARA